jgi:plasmid stabilization system protein ParE
MLLRLLKRKYSVQSAEFQKNPYLFEADKLKDPPDAAFRAFIVFSYRVSYQIVAESKEIRILRIRHTSQEPLGY